MTYNDIIQKWLFVAYSEKKPQNRSKSAYREEIKREVAGAKGVGRFSCDRLGASLQLITKTKDEDYAHVVNVNWNKFEVDDTKEFIEIPVDYTQIAKLPSGFNWGTTLIVDNLREEWNREELLKLKRSLMKLISPDADKGELPFDIEMDVPSEKETDERLLKEYNNEKDKCMNELENYYGKFCEDKRLLRKHGQVEYRTSMKYIHDYLKAGDRILDIGAGTGRYSVALSQEGYEVDAIELVKYNLGMLKAKKSNVKAYQGTALDLSRYQDETFDLTLLFGPMYHLFSYEDKLKALSEAKRVTKTGGVILVAYVMNDYSVLVHGFRDGHIKEALKSGKIDEHFQTQTNIDDLYSYVRIELINQLNQDLNLKRIKIIAADGPADYMRPILNKMDDETFELFMQYHLSTCERLDMIGASSHTLDILRKV